MDVNVPAPPPIHAHAAFLERAQYEKVNEHGRVRRAHFTRWARGVLPVHPSRDVDPPSKRARARCASAWSCRGRGHGSRMGAPRRRQCRATAWASLPPQTGAAPAAGEAHVALGCGAGRSPTRPRSPADRHGAPATASPAPPCSVREKNAWTAWSGRPSERFAATTVPPHPGGHTGSARPSSSGSGCRQGARSVTRVAHTLSSPAAVLPGNPRTSGRPRPHAAPRARVHAAQRWRGQACTHATRRRRRTTAYPRGPRAPAAAARLRVAAACWPSRRSGGVGRPGASRRTRAWPRRSVAARCGLPARRPGRGGRREKGAIRGLRRPRP